MLIMFAVSVLALEALLFTSEIWRFRKVITILLLIMNTGVAILLLIYGLPWLITVALLLVFAYRYVNFVRILKNRVNADHLFASARLTAFCLGIALVVVAALRPLSSQILTNLPVIQLIVSLSLFVIVCVSIIKLRKNYPIYSYADRDLPTVSVCIPARNETVALELCMTSLLASTYPKLEIIVLDDCSTDRTPDIIKKFAHDGVRFIKGNEPSEQWLPKNSAYQRLSEEASGAYILFCGVDTKFAPQTINKLVGLALTNRVSMVSVLPRRLTSNSLAAIIQPMRYWWELAIPRWLTKSPPVLSTCWLIERERLLEHGGFAAVKRTVLPERYFAKQCATTGDYIFTESNDTVDVQTNKVVSEQRETALRVRYPQVHRRPELVMLITAFQVVFLIGPFIGLVVGIVTSDTLMLVLSSLSLFLNLIVHVIIVAQTNPANVPIALFNYIAVVITELVIGNESMLRYEFSDVQWKQRNICLPVMRVEPRLPRI